MKKKIATFVILLVLSLPVQSSLAYAQGGYLGSFDLGSAISSIAGFFNFGGSPPVEPLVSGSEQTGVNEVDYSLLYQELPDPNDCETRIILEETAATYSADQLMGLAAPSEDVNRAVKYAISCMIEKASGDGISLHAEPAYLSFEQTKGFRYNVFADRDPITWDQWQSLPLEQRENSARKPGTPGMSRQHWGTEFHIISEDPRAPEWVQGNVGRFGFCQPYESESQTRLADPALWSYYPLANQLAAQFYGAVTQNDFIRLGINEEVLFRNFDVYKSGLIGTNPLCLPGTAVVGKISDLDRLSEKEIAERLVIADYQSAFNPNWEEARGIVYDYQIALLGVISGKSPESATAAEEAKRALDDANRRVWNQRVARILEQESDSIGELIKKSEENYGFSTETPFCDAQNANKYACIQVQKEGGLYDIRRCIVSSRELGVGSEQSVTYSWEADDGILDKLYAWVSGSKLDIGARYDSLDSCQQDCQKTGQCVQQAEQSQLRELGGNSLIVAGEEWLKVKADFNPLKAGIDNLAGCYKKDDYGFCISRLKPCDEVQSSVCHALARSAAVLMIKEIEDNWKYYQQQRPDIRLCTAAQRAQPKVRNSDVYSDFYQADAYRLIAQTCGYPSSASPGQPVDRQAVDIAKQKINDLEKGRFADGVWHVFESFAEPTNLKILAGTAVVSVLIPPVGAAIGGSSLSTAVTTARITKLFHAGVAGYFGVELGIGLKRSLELCRNADSSISEEQCGEAAAQAVLLVLLVHPVIKGVEAEFRARSVADIVPEIDRSIGIARANLATERASLGGELAKLENKLENNPYDYDAAVARLKYSEEIAAVDKRLVELEKLGDSRTAKAIAADILSKGGLARYDLERLNKRVLEIAKQSALRNSEISARASQLLDGMEQSVKRAEDSLQAEAEKSGVQVPESLRAAEKTAGTFADRISIERFDFIQLSQNGINLVKLYQEPRIRDALTALNSKGEPVLKEVVRNLGLDGSLVDNPAVFYRVNSLNPGGFKYVYLVEIVEKNELGSFKPLGRFVLKIGRGPYHDQRFLGLIKVRIYASEFEMAKALEGRRILPKELTDGVIEIETGGEKEIVLYEEFIEESSLEVSNRQNWPALVRANGELDGRLWEATRRTVTRDGKLVEVAFINLDAHLGNLKFLEKDGKIEAIFIEIENPFRHQTFESGGFTLPELVVERFLDKTGVWPPEYFEEWFDGIKKYLGSDEKVVNDLLYMAFDTESAVFQSDAAALAPGETNKLVDQIIKVLQRPEYARYANAVRVSDAR